MNIRTITLFTSSLFLLGCASHASDSEHAISAPTDMAGIYKAVYFGGTTTWHILEDGTGVACDTRTGIAANNAPPLRDLVINGTTVYEAYKYELKNITENGFLASGIMDIEFKRIKKLPVACRY